MLHRLRHDIINDFRTNKFAYLFVSFFIVTGFIAGCISIRAFSEQSILDIMNSFGTITTIQNGAFLGVLLFYLFDTLKYFVSTSLLVLWPILFPVALLIFMIKGISFAAFFYTLNFDIGFINYLWALPAMVGIFIGEFILYTVLGKILTLEAYRNFKLLNTPRTPKDRIQSSNGHFRQCAKLFAISLFFIIIKSIVMPAIINLS